MDGTEELGNLIRCKCGNEFRDSESRKSEAQFRMCPDCRAGVSEGAKRPHGADLLEYVTRGNLFIKRLADGFAMIASREDDEADKNLKEDMLSRRASYNKYKRIGTQQPNRARGE